MGDVLIAEPKYDFWGVTWFLLCFIWGTLMSLVNTLFLSSNRVQYFLSRSIFLGRCTLCIGDSSTGCCCYFRFYEIFQREIGELLTKIDDILGG